METPSKPENEDRRIDEPEAKASYNSEVESSSDESSSSSWKPGSSSSSSTSNTKTFKIVASRERRSVVKSHPPLYYYITFSNFVYFTILEEHSSSKARLRASFARR